MDRTRRAMLATVAIGGFGGMAGCSGTSDDEPTQGEDDGGTPLRRWLPARDVDQSARHLDYTRHDSVEYDPTAFFYGSRGLVEPLGFDADAVEADLSITPAGNGTVTVSFGSFDPDGVRSAVVDERVGQYRGARLVRLDGEVYSGGPAAVGVTDSEVVVSKTDTDPVVSVRRTLDAAAGAVERAASDGAYETALEPLRGEDYRRVARGERVYVPIERLTAVGSGATFQSEIVVVTVTHVFEDATTADVETVRQNSPSGDRWRSVSYESEGRVVVRKAEFDPSVEPS